MWPVAHSSRRFTACQGTGAGGALGGENMCRGVEPLGFSHRSHKPLAFPVLAFFVRSKGSANRVGGVGGNADPLTMGMLIQMSKK